MPAFSNLKSMVTNSGSAKGGFTTGGGGGIQGGAPTTLPSSADDDELARFNLILRGCQIFFAVVMLLIAVVMASFQSKWVGSPSGLTGFLIFVAVASLVSSLVFLVVPVIYERSGYKTLKGLDRALKEVRVGLVINGIFTGLLLIVSVTQTISAYTSAGCKNPDNDPHAAKGKDGDAFRNALKGWCRDKRAQSAFCWFLWITWLLALLLFFRQWRTDRKQGPRIPPFVHPTDDSAFEPLGDDDDDDRGIMDEMHVQRYGGASYNPLSDIEAKYGFNTSSANNASSNPFEDRYQSAPPPTRPSYDYNAYADSHQSLPGGYQDRHHDDPYQQSGHGIPNAPPRLPDLGYSQAYR
ncbi:hypothetical protein IE53DRAFT_390466 [Violaceomyces palustris]|uniref:Uncharacterized protein n=1 Tax=Violaceomyces palustris TaxID=1673888 RepID=A0ACD0NNM4_9BASI|nr:hypothetical protein IE53DRAFT_390466 [Violaceomyces palustris]